MKGGEICVQNRCSTCCVGSEKFPIIMPLSNEEFQLLAVAGANIKWVVENDGMWDGPGKKVLVHEENGVVYFLTKLLDKCPFLSVAGLCELINDPKRPKTCFETEPGSKHCDDCRINHGLIPLRRNKIYNLVTL